MEGTLPPVRYKVVLQHHPQTDGQTEVTKRGMETDLRCFASDKPKSWVQFIPWEEYSYNTSFHSSIRMSPFIGVYGRDPPVLLKYETGSTSNAELEGQLIEWDETQKLLKEHLHRVQQMVKTKADASRRELVYEIGDLVFSKLRPYRQHMLAKRANEKLSARFNGPYEIEARVGEVVYRLKLPIEAKIHNTFHVSQHKKMVGNSVEATPLPSQLTAEGVSQNLR